MHDDWKPGLRNLRQALQERDDQRAFDRCIVGGEVCKNPSIEAHSIPMACLELIANRNTVVASCAVPPRDPVTYHYLKPLAKRSISTFSVGRWSCEEHDRLFAPVDSKNIDVEDAYNLFLIVYRTTLRATQLGLRTVERIVTTTLDPATPKPQGVPEPIIRRMREFAVDATKSMARTIHLKWKMDSLLKACSFDTMEYRTSSWRTEPVVAAAGMSWEDGPGKGTYWGGEDSVLPVWMIVLPQRYGQLAITASIRGYPATIHNSMPIVNKGIVERGKLWTKVISNRLLNNSIDIAVSNTRYEKLQEVERQILHEYLQARSIFGTSRNKELPNLFEMN